MKKQSGKIEEGRFSKLKQDVIISILKVIEHNYAAYIEQAISMLRIYASYYRVPLRTAPYELSLNKCLRDFILNEGGYNQTIVQLYNVLLNAKKQTSD